MATRGALIVFIAALLGCADAELGTLPRPDAGDVGGDCAAYSPSRDVLVPFTPRLAAWPQRSYLGRATVTSVGPTALSLSDGQRFEVGLPEALVLPLGALVEVELEAERYWQAGTAFRFGVWARRGEVRGPLVFAAWEWQHMRAMDFGDAEVLGALAGDEVCPIGCLETRRAQAYRVRLGPDDLRVEGAAQHGAYLVRTYGYTSEGWISSCNDGPAPSRHMGWIARTDVAFEVEPAPVDCGPLDEEACLGAAPCALFGGDGVPYRCVPALPGCEGIVEADLCEASASCVWLPDSRALGGPAPGCRDACTTDQPCGDAASRFCQALPTDSLTCTPGGPGWCARRADASECPGSGPLVCACESRVGLGWHHVPACDRTARGVPFVTTSTACD